MNVSMIPFVPFNAVRVALYRLIGYSIGRRVFIGMQCYLDDTHPSRILIEDDVTVSFRVTIACHGPRSRDHRLEIKKGSYIGTGAILLGGRLRGDVVIGPYASIGAGAVIVRNVPPLAVAVGVPARIIRTFKTPWEANEAHLLELAEQYSLDAPRPPRVEPVQESASAQRIVRIEPADLAQSDSVIRYTLDGSLPDEESPVYTAPIAIPSGATLQAREFRPGHRPGSVVSYPGAGEVGNGLELASNQANQRGLVDG